jgi:hypothetical protein
MNALYLKVAWTQAQLLSTEVDEDEPLSARAPALKREVEGEIPSSLEWGLAQSLSLVLRVGID